MATINLLPLTTSPNQDISPIKNINKFPVGKTRRKLSLDVKADNSRVKGRIALKNVNKLFHEASFRDEIDPAKFVIHNIFNDTKYSLLSSLLVVIETLYFTICAQQY